MIRKIFYIFILLTIIVLISSCKDIHDFIPYDLNDEEDITLIYETGIYLINLDSSNLTKLINISDNISHSYPNWSPDSKRIAFEKDGGIYVMHYDGSQTKLTNIDNVKNISDFYPSWSPDGSKIAFVSYRDKKTNIYVMNPDGSNQIKLTDNDSFASYYPSWSPDGSKIAFVSTKEENMGLYVINKDGSNLTRLTYDKDLEPNLRDNFKPQWSPDGTKIIFVSFGKNRGLYTINTDGSNLSKLTSDDSDSYPSWSPDGSKIAFTSRGNIFVTNTDGLNRDLVTIIGNVFQNYPSWSPDGSKIAFISNYKIYTTNINNLNLVKYFDYLDCYCFNYKPEKPVWSPDGTKIAFILNKEFDDDANPCPYSLVKSECKIKQ